MAKASAHVAYYLILLTFCIGEGDGRWKKTDREILQRDIHLYKKIAARVEHELQEYYDEYVHDDDEDQRFHPDRNDYKSDENLQLLRTKEEQRNGEVTTRKPFLSKETEAANDIPRYTRPIVNESVSSTESIRNNPDEKIKNFVGKWPKFEDILLAIGKKYDWKNDRWIKVKEKFKNKETERKLLNSLMFHEKHRFSYRSIKLNRGKNKRKMVIAVTAIR